MKPLNRKDRYCQICGDPVPWISRTGKEIQPSNYSTKQCCNNPECYKTLRKQTADRKARKIAARRYYEKPDLLEQWCLGGARR